MFLAKLPLTVECSVIIYTACTWPVFGKYMTHLYVLSLGTILWSRPCLIFYITVERSLHNGMKSFNIIKLSSMQFCCVIKFCQPVLLSVKKPWLHRINHYLCFKDSCKTSPLVLNSSLATCNVKIRRLYEIYSFKGILTDLHIFAEKLRQLYDLLIALLT